MRVWKKPVIVFYKERLQEPERKAFAVVKAERLQIAASEREGSKFRGSIEDFFPLMGNIDYVSSREGRNDRYVLCWFDDHEDDLGKAWRRLTGVMFLDRISVSTDEKGKRTYNASFRAEHGKLD